MQIFTVGFQQTNENANDFDEGPRGADSRRILLDGRGEGHGQPKRRPRQAESAPSGQLGDARFMHRATQFRRWRRNDTTPANVRRCTDSVGLSCRPAREGIDLGGRRRQIIEIVVCFVLRMSYPGHARRVLDLVSVGVGQLGLRGRVVGNLPRRSNRRVCGCSLHHVERRVGNPRRRLSRIGVDGLLQWFRWQVGFSGDTTRRLILALLGSPRLPLGLPFSPGALFQKRVAHHRHVADVDLALGEQLAEQGLVALVAASDCRHDCRRARDHHHDVLNL